MVQKLKIYFYRRIPQNPRAVVVMYVVVISQLHNLATS